MNDHPSILVSEYYEHVQGEEDINDYEEDGSAGCFGVFGFPWKQSSSDNERKYLLGGCNTKTKKVPWWRMKLNKTREFTEVLGGPKWKNLVRKIGAYCRRCRKQRIRLCKKKKPNRFRYDVHSYALNFDNGTDGRDGVVDFSARFAAPSSNLQSSTATLVVKPPMSASIGSEG